MIKFDSTAKEYPMTDKNLEENLEFTPRFDVAGLIPCITTDSKTGEILMFAFMNEEALNKTIQTGQVHYWSRSRAELWHKGATSGHFQKVISIRTDCDQDCIWITVDAGPACHTGRKTCFYRELDPKSGQLRFIDTD